MEELLATDGTMSDEQNEFIATEGIISEEVETIQDIETTEDELAQVEVQEQALNQKKSKGVAKLLAEKNDLKSRLQVLEIENALVKLEKQYGEFDQDAVLSIKESNPTLPYEDALLLWKVKQPKQEAPRKSNPIVGSEARNLGSNTITNAELVKLPQNLYNVAMEKIEKGQLTVQ